jgi:hypothetical protein
MVTLQLYTQQPPLKMESLRQMKRKPDNTQNSKQMTLSTKFNLKFATLQKYSSKKTTLNIASIQQNQ